MDPRQRGLFGASWYLAYVATLAKSGVEAVALGAPTGPLGFIYRKTDHEQPWYDSLEGGAVYPAFHVISGLANGSGSRLVDTEVSEPAAIRALAYRAAKGTTLWLANPSDEERTIKLEGVSGAVFGGFLDEASYVTATTDPAAFQASYEPIVGGRRLVMSPYAVAILSIND